MVSHSLMPWPGASAGPWRTFPWKAESLNAGGDSRAWQLRGPGQPQHEWRQSDME